MPLAKVKIDRKKHEVHVGWKLIKLAPKEFEILSLFEENRGTVLDREIILSTLWGTEGTPDDTRTIDQHIARLRRKLGRNGAKLLVTVPKYGYKFVA